MERLHFNPNDLVVRTTQQIRARSCALRASQVVPGLALCLFVAGAFIYEPGCSYIGRNCDLFDIAAVGAPISVVLFPMILGLTRSEACWHISKGTRALDGRSCIEMQMLREKHAAIDDFIARIHASGRQITFGDVGQALRAIDRVPRKSREAYENREIEEARQRLTRPQGTLEQVSAHSTS